MSRMFSLVPPAVVLTLAVVTPVFTEAPTEPLLYKLNSAARQVTVSRM